jgi:DNA polymerase-3 subunit gamma/tau
MENLPLHLKYRPETFSDFLNNDSLVASLKQTLDKKKRIVRSFLFHGPSGCGKTTLARIIKNELGCSDRDFKEYNMGNTRGIDTIREIIANLIYPPMNGPVTIYLLDEAHKLTGEAENALLKAVEETPDHIRFILCTTEPEKLIPTLRNRCAQFQVQPFIMPSMTSFLRGICKTEGLDIKPALLREIAKVVNGSPRQALVLLEQISSITDYDMAVQIINNGTPDETKTIELCRALLKKDWPTVAEILKGLNQEPENIRYAVLGYMNTVLLSRGDDVTAGILSTFTESFMYSGKAGLTLACFLSCK